MEDLGDICSGKFSTQTQNAATSNILHIEPTQATSQDLLELCSGGFGLTEQTTEETKQTPQSKSLACNLNDESKQENQKCFQIISTQSSLNTEIKNLGCENEDRLISQLLDEEEMMQFKKKFDTPLKTGMEEQEIKSSQHVGRILYDSDDEEDVEIHKKKRKAKVVDSGVYW